MFLLLYLPSSLILGNDEREIPPPRRKAGWWWGGGEGNCFQSPGHQHAEERRAYRLAEVTSLTDSHAKSRG